MCKAMTVVRALALLTLITLAVYPLSAQFKSTVPLVIAPATVTGLRGRFIGGLTASGSFPRRLSGRKRVGGLRCVYTEMVGNGCDLDVVLLVNNTG
jgi:hypothetical protein